MLAGSAMKIILRKFQKHRHKYKGFRGFKYGGRNRIQLIGRHLVFVTKGLIVYRITEWIVVAEITFKNSFQNYL